MMQLAETSIEEENTQIEIDMEEWYQVCLERPDAFAHYYFPHILKTKSSHFHFYLYSTIKRISENPTSDFVAIAAPRASAKTQILNVILPIWCIIFNKKNHIILISETGRQAENNLESIRHELTHNERIENHFPHIFGEGPKWRNELLITRNGVNIVALGSGKQIRGAQKLGSRPDLVLCHTKGTKILMKEGYKDVSELQIGDIVYNHKWEQDKVVAWKPHEWEGNYYTLSVYGHHEKYETNEDHTFIIKKKDGTIRKDNKILVNYGMAYQSQVKNIKKGDLIGFPINKNILSVAEIATIEHWKCFDKNYAEITKRDDAGRILKTSRSGGYVPVTINGSEAWLSSKEFWFLAGCYLGDGTLKKNRKKSHGVSYSCNSYNTYHIQKIQKAIRMTGSNCLIRNRGTVTDIYWYCTTASSIFETWKKEKNSHKVPPRSIEFLDPELQKELIKGYIATDGHVHNKDGIRIASVCLELLEFIQRILLRLNIVSSIHKHPYYGNRQLICGRYVNIQEQYILYFKNGVHNLGFKLAETNRCRIRGGIIEDGYLWRKIRSVTSVYKKDIIYPFTVEKEHTYLTKIEQCFNCDDIESDQQVQTRNQRDKLEEWLTKAVLGLKGANTKMDVIVTGTILHPQSLLSKLLDPIKYPSWEKHRFQAIYKFSNSPKWKEWEKIYTHRENPNRKELALQFYKNNMEEMLEGTEVLWPDGEPYYNLMEYRINSGLRSFQQEKQNSPIDPSSCVFNIDKIVYFNREDVDTSNLVFFGAIDPASGDAILKGDLSAIITLGKDIKTGIIYVFDAWSGEKGPTDCIKYIKEMHRRYNYKKFGLDSDALKLFKEFLLKEIPSLENKLVTYDLRLKKTKRIDRLEPLIHDGTIRIQSNQYELLDELTFYPKSDHDDVLDALEICVRLAGTRGYRLLMY